MRIETAEGTLVEEFGESIGVATNNVAEYRGLLSALEWARAHGHHTVHVRSDSLLLVQQMLGNYKVKNAGLQPLHARARLLAHDIGRVTFEHVRRERNADADRLANAAMDDAIDVASGLDTRDRGDSRPIHSRPRTRMAAAIRPAARPSRRYEQQMSAFVNVQSSLQ